MTFNYQNWWELWRELPYFPLEFPIPSVVRIWIFSVTKQYYLAPIWMSSETDIIYFFNTKDNLKETEEKYRKAMVSIAQLDNEKQALLYQVDCLKDRYIVANMINQEFLLTI